MSKLQTRYTLKDPKGELLTITDLKRFCDDNQLEYNNMVDALQNYTTHNGWIVEAGMYEQNTRYGKMFTIYNPNGYIVTEKNLNNFCRNNNLNAATMAIVKSGSTSYSNHRGWAFSLADHNTFKQSDRELMTYAPQVMQYDNEQWKIVDGFPKYEISTLGRIKSNTRTTPKILKQVRDSAGYYHYRLTNDGGIVLEKAHRLTALNWIPNPLNLPQVDHLDGNTANNKLSNLRWVTAHTNRHNATERNENMLSSRKCKLKEIYLKDEIGNIYITDVLKRFCEQYELNTHSVSMVLKGNMKSHRQWRVPTQLEISNASIIIDCKYKGNK